MASNGTKLLDFIFLIWDKVDSDSKIALRATCRQASSSWHANTTRVRLGEAALFKASIGAPQLQAHVGRFIQKLIHSSPALVKVEFELSHMEFITVHMLLSAINAGSRQITIACSYKNKIEPVGAADADLLEMVATIIYSQNVKLALSLDLKLAVGPDTYLLNLIPVLRLPQLVQLDVRIWYGVYIPGSSYALYTADDYQTVNLARLDELEDLVREICHSPALCSFISNLDTNWLWAQHLIGNNKLHNLSVDFLRGDLRCHTIANRIGNGAFPALTELSFGGSNTLHGVVMFNALNNNNCWGRLTCLKSLDLTLQIGDQNATALSCLSELVQLETLGLRRNNFTHNGAELLVPALSSLTTLITLDLGDNPWQARGATTLALALPCLTRLTELLLDQAKITGQGACEITSAVTTSIECLNFQFNRITDPWAIQIGDDVIARLPKLTVLAMEGNPMTSLGAGQVRSRGVPIRFHLL